MRVLINGCEPEQPHASSRQIPKRNRAYAGPLRWFSNNILVHRILFELMAISADSTRICSEYKPGPIQSLARGGGAAMQDDVVELPGGSTAARRIRPAVVYMSQN